MNDSARRIDARALSKLRWRCRRGMLENDLLIERFFARHADTLTDRQAEGLRRLMELPDNDLLDLLLARKAPEGDLLRDDVGEVLALLRTPAGRAAAVTLVENRSTPPSTSPIEERR